MFKKLQRSLATLVHADGFKTVDESFDAAKANWLQMEQVLLEVRKQLMDYQDAMRGLCQSSYGCVEAIAQLFPSPGGSSLTGTAEALQHLTQGGSPAGLSSSPAAPLHPYSPLIYSAKRTLWNLQHDRLDSLARRISATCLANCTELLDKFERIHLRVTERDESLKELDYRENKCIDLRKELAKLVAAGKKEPSKDEERRVRNEEALSKMKFAFDATNAQLTAELVAYWDRRLDLLAPIMNAFFTASATYTNEMQAACAEIAREREAVPPVDFAAVLYEVVSPQAAQATAAMAAAAAAASSPAGDGVSANGTRANRTASLAGSLPPLPPLTPSTSSTAAVAAAVAAAAPAPKASEDSSPDTVTDASSSGSSLSASPSPAGVASSPLLAASASPPAATVASAMSPSLAPATASASVAGTPVVSPPVPARPRKPMTTPTLAALDASNAAAMNVPATATLPPPSFPPVTSSSPGAPPAASSSSSLPPPLVIAPRPPIVTRGSSSSVSSSPTSPISAISPRSGRGSVIVGSSATLAAIASAAATAGAGAGGAPGSRTTSRTSRGVPPPVAVAPIIDPAPFPRTTSFSDMHQRVEAEITKFKVENPQPQSHHHEHAHSTPPATTTSTTAVTTPPAASVSPVVAAASIPSAVASAAAPSTPTAVAASASTPTPVVAATVPVVAPASESVVAPETAAPASETTSTVVATPVVEEKEPEVALAAPAAVPVVAAAPVAVEAAAPAATASLPTEAAAETS